MPICSLYSLHAIKISVPILGHQNNRDISKEYGIEMAFEEGLAYDYTANSVQWKCNRETGLERGIRWQIDRSYINQASIDTFVVSRGYCCLDF